MSLVQNTLVGFHRGLIRLSGGRLGSHIRKNSVLLLTTKGRRTGKVRCIPLLYFDDAGDYVLIASNGGAEQHPAWYFNLQAEPTATVEMHGVKQQVVASDITDPDERAAPLEARERRLRQLRRLCRRRPTGRSRSCGSIPRPEAASSKSDPYG